MPKKMHIGYDLSWTHLEGRWSIPGSWSHKVFPDIGMYKEMALLAERGLLDFIFFGDGSGIPSTWKGTRDDAVKWAVGWPSQDMSPYIAIMSEITKHIGFGLTYSSTFMHPFYVARLLNSLDHVTNGRIAFNVIASSRQADAANYGFDELMEHSRRYDRMEEFMDVCKALWNSVEPDALIWDRDTGIAADPAKVHAVDHKGEYFSVAGPLSCVPSPQIEPVIVQAGASPRGIRASAHFVDHVFAASPGLAKQIQHRKALDDALLAEGRDPSKVGMTRPRLESCGMSCCWSRRIPRKQRDGKNSCFPSFPRRRSAPLRRINTDTICRTCPTRSRSMRSIRTSLIGTHHPLAS